MARVTLVVNNADEGSETFLHALVGHLGSAGHDVTVHAMIDRGATIRSDRGSGFGDATRSSALPGARSPRVVPAAARLAATDPTVVAVARRSVRRFGRGGRAVRAAALAAPIVATRPDVVHLAFSGIGVALVDALELLDPSTRLVVSCRGTGELVTPVLDPSVRSALRRVLQRADAVHAVAEAVAAAAIRWGAVADRVHVVRPAVDPDRFPERQTRHGDGGGSLRLLTVSRLHWVKAIEVQVDAVAALTRHGRVVTLDVVGDGPERAALEFRAHATDVAERVRFHGPTAPTRVRELLGGSDVYVSSSLSEGTSNSVLEAMATGLPVVATAAGGMAEMLVDGQNAMVVPLADAGSLASAVVRLDEDSSLSDRIRAGGRRTVTNGYTLDQQRRRVEALYEELLGRPPGHGGAS